MQRHGLFRENASKYPIKLGAAERKILIVFIYYVVLGAIATSSFSIYEREAQSFVESVFLYFICERNGSNPSCDRGTFESKAYPELAAIANGLFGLFPVVNLVYVINIKELSQWCRGKLRGSKTQPIRVLPRNVNKPVTMFSPAN